MDKIKTRVLTDAETTELSAEEKKQKSVEHLKNEIEKLNNKESNIYFFVIDSKGVPSGTVRYIYVIARVLKDDGYNVHFLYQNEPDDPYVGVEDFLGDRYNDIQALDLAKDKVLINPSDIIVIPELFSNIIRATKQMPAKKIIISQNYDYVTESLPLGQDWGMLGVLDVITNTEKQKKLLLDIMPFLRVDVIPPSIEPFFYTKENGIRKLQIGILTADRSAVNKIAKMFFMKYPVLRFVTFKHLTGLNQELFADELRSCFATVVSDVETYFGYQILESIRSGNITVAVMPHEQVDWMKDIEGKFTNSVLWVPNLNEVADVLATAVSNWMDDSIPAELYNNMKVFDNRYTKEEQQECTLDVFSRHIEQRIKELTETVKLFEK